MFRLEIVGGRLIRTYDEGVKGIIREAILDTLYSPDMWRLERYQWHHLFVYGEMQRNFPRHCVIESGCQPWHRRAFTEQSFSMYKKKLGIATQAIALSSAYSGAPLSNVGGQVFNVRTHVLKEIDKLYQNNVAYHRELVSVMIPYRKQIEVPNGTGGWTLRNYEECIATQKVWMYVGIDDYWNRQLDGGYLFSPVTLIKEGKIPYVPEYYYFSKLEYAEQHRKSSYTLPSVSEQ